MILYLYKVDAVIRFQDLRHDSLFMFHNSKSNVPKVYEVESAYGEGGYVSVPEGKPFTVSDLNVQVHRVILTVYRENVPLSSYVASVDF